MTGSGSLDATRMIAGFAGGEGCLAALRLRRGIDGGGSLFGRNFGKCGGANDGKVGAGRGQGREG